MRNFQLFLALVVSGLLGSMSYGQQGKECLKAVGEYLEWTSKFGMPQDGQAYEMDYVQESVVQGAVEQIQTKQDFRVRITRDNIAIESDEVSVISDKNDSFYIDNMQKMIIWGDGVDSLINHTNPLDVLEQQKNLFENCLFISCNREVKEKRVLDIIKLKTTKELKETTNAETIEISFDTEENRIYKVKVEYTGDYKVQRQTTTYKKLDFNVKWKSRGAVYRQVFTRTGELNPKYNNYTLIDNKN